MDNWLSVSEVETQTRIPERTIRRYLSLHGHHIQTRKQGRSVFISESAITLLRQIRDWYESGWNAERVEEGLAERGVPATITIDGHDTAMTAAEAFQTLQSNVVEAMTAMAKEMAELRREVAATREQNEKLENLLETKLEDRDKKLMETIRSIQESKLNEQPKKRSWWPWGN